jgi:hypothetical protein
MQQLCWGCHAWQSRQSKSRPKAERHGQIFQQTTAGVLISRGLRSSHLASWPVLDWLGQLKAAVLELIVCLLCAGCLVARVCAQVQRHLQGVQVRMPQLLPFCDMGFATHTGRSCLPLSAQQEPEQQSSSDTGRTLGGAATYSCTDGRPAAGRPQEVPV